MFLKIFYSLNSYTQSSPVSYCSKGWGYTDEQDMVPFMRLFVLVKNIPHFTSCEMDYHLQVIETYKSYLENKRSYRFKH